MNGNMRRMIAPPEWRCSVADLPAGRSAKFRLRCGGRTVEGFVVNHAGGYHAYVNRCAHVGTPLDLWPNEFFTEDYEPDSGRCTAGPCLGDALIRLPLRREGDAIVVSCPRE